MEQPIRLAVVHRNQLLRECLVSVLAEEEAFGVEGIDPGQPDISEALARSRAQVVLVDLSLREPTAAEVCGEVRKRLDGAKVLILVSSHNVDQLVPCVEAGAHGCVLEESSLDEVTDAVARVHQGETFCSPRIAQSMFAQLALFARQSRWQQRLATVDLTSRELEVLRQVAEGLSNKQIARKLSVSLYTVKNHVHNVLEKLQAENRFEAVELARQRRWLSG